MARSNSTLLIILLLIFTFPVWIGIFGGLFGVAAGLFGACIGIISGIFGAIFGLVFGVFGSFPHFHVSSLFIIALIFFAVLISRNKNKK